MTIVVLSGWLSSERDVSISTGTNVCKALRKLGHKVLLLDVFLGYENLGDNPDDVFTIENDDTNKWSSVGESIPDIDRIKYLRNIAEDGFIGKNVIHICKSADIVFMALHGENGENGKLQAMFDLLGIKYTGTGYLGSAIALNKKLTKKLLAGTHILTPAYKVLNAGNTRNYNLNGFPLPCVIKPCTGGSSIGVSIAYTPEELARAVGDAASFEDELIIEEYIEGREFSVGVIGDKILPIIEIIPKQGFYDYVNKYQPGLTKEICPAFLDDFLTDRIKLLALDVHRTLGLEVYSRIDFILDKKKSGVLSGSQYTTRNDGDQFITSRSRGNGNFLWTIM